MLIPDTTIDAAGNYSFGWQTFDRFVQTAHSTDAFGAYRMQLAELEIPLAGRWREWRWTLPPPDRRHRTVIKRHPNDIVVKI